MKKLGIAILITLKEDFFETICNFHETFLS